MCINSDSIALRFDSLGRGLKIGLLHFVQFERVTHLSVRVMSVLPSWTSLSRIIYRARSSNTLLRTFIFYLFEIKVRVLLIVNLIRRSSRDVWLFIVCEAYVETLPRSDLSIWIGFDRGFSHFNPDSRFTCVMTWFLRWNRLLTVLASLFVGALWLNFVPFRTILIEVLELRVGVARELLIQNR